MMRTWRGAADHSRCGQRRQGKLGCQQSTAVYGGPAVMWSVPIVFYVMASLTGELQCISVIETFKLCLKSQLFSRAYGWQSNLCFFVVLNLFCAVCFKLIYHILLCSAPLSMQLHWLPVRQRVNFKLAVLIFEVLNGLALPYLSDDCQLISATNHQQLRSSSIPTCVLQSTATRLRDGVFAAARQILWNSLPAELLTTWPLCLRQFCRAPKIHLFSWWPQRLVTFFCFLVPFISVLTYLYMALYKCVLLIDLYIC